MGLLGWLFNGSKASGRRPGTAEGKDRRSPSASSTMVSALTSEPSISSRAAVAVSPAWSNRTVESCHVAQRREVLRQLINEKLREAGPTFVRPLALRVVISTFNVANRLPKSDDAPEFRRWLCAGGPPPDMAAVGLQELDTSVSSVLLEKDSNRVCVWESFIGNLLGCDNEEYHLLKRAQVAGLILLVFVKARYKDEVSGEHATVVRTGLSGTLGNKGAVALGVTICGRRFLFVNSHLVPHDNQEHKRHKGYHSILRGLQLRFSGGQDPVDLVWPPNNEFVKVPEAVMLLDDEGSESSLDYAEGDVEEGGDDVSQTHLLELFDYAFWFGDLNYRLAVTDNPALVRDVITRGHYQELLRFDELRQALVSDMAFSGWRESYVTFPPTYKYTIGSSVYNTKRTPAWTDRVLYLHPKPDPITPLVDGKVAPQLRTLQSQPVNIRMPSPHGDGTPSSLYSCTDLSGSIPGNFRFHRSAPIPRSSPPSPPPSWRPDPSLPELSPEDPHPSALESALHATMVDAGTNKIAPQEDSYSRYEVTVSDHRPVSAAFVVQCQEVDRGIAAEVLRDPAINALVGELRALEAQRARPDAV